MKHLLIALLLWVPFASCFAQTERQKDDVLRQIIQMPSGPNFAIVSAKIRLGKDVELAYKQLDTLLSRPYGDMFWMYACTGLYYATRDVLRPEYKARIRECWKRFTPYRGDTENHFLMYYGSLYLMSEAWPNLDGSEWFTGQTSEEIHKQSEDYLNHWIDETARYGTTEWDSPRYGYYYITPLVLLAEYTKEPRLKRRCEMMLDLFLADYAIEYLDGSYCGAHSRVSDQAAIDPKAAEITSYGEYFFEGSVTHLQPDVAFAALTGFECPTIIREIAHERREPFVNEQLKRGRTTIRGTSIQNAVVRKYSYMTKDYSLGSMQGGIVQPIQQQSWSLVFKSSKPHNIITGLQPYVSADELAMFFPEEPSYMLEKIGSVKTGYPSEDKWVGGSPYERIYQNRDMLVALYDIPDSVRYPEYDLFFPHGLLNGSGKDTVRAPGWRSFDLGSGFGWIYIMSAYEESNGPQGIRLRARSQHGGYLIWCEPPESFTVNAGDSLRVRDSTVEAFLQNGIGWSTIFEFSSKSPDANWLYNSPFIHSRLGSGVVDLEARGEKLKLDFN